MKRIFYLFIIFVVILSVIFLWNELSTLSFALKINDEKLSNYFSAIGTVAAAISIYFLYSQLIEMKDARASISQPDLYPSGVVFDTFDQIHEYDESKTPICYFRIRDRNSGELLDPAIELHNIGLGAAKNISIDWNYDLNEIQELIKDIYKDYKKKKTEREHVDFLPANGKTNLEIPGYYFNCCGSLINENDNIKKPKLEVQIKYQDIQNNNYDKIFKAKITTLDLVPDYVKVKFEIVP